jgi:hypothetical protein
VPPDPPISPAPTTLPDLVTFRVGRRVLRRDVALHGDLAERLLAGVDHLDPRRLAAFSGLAEELCDDVANQLLFEDTLLWPVLERLAPDAVPFPELRARRAAVRARVDDGRRATRAVVADLRQRPAALSTREDHRRVRVLAVAWRAVREELEGYFDASDDDVDALVTRYLPRAEWMAILDEVRGRLPDRRGAGARILDAASGPEREQLTGQLGARPIAGWRQQIRRRRAVETLVFGAGAAAVPSPRDPGPALEGQGG